jgi:hypothetical protein
MLGRDERGFAPFTPTRGRCPWTREHEDSHPANLIVANLPI